MQEAGGKNKSRGALLAGSLALSFSRSLLSRSLALLLSRSLVPSFSRSLTLLLSRSLTLILLPSRPLELALSFSHSRAPLRPLAVRFTYYFVYPLVLRMWIFYVCGCFARVPGTCGG